jgi:uncharacterized RDD family membrane protein YckC
LPVSEIPPYQPRPDGPSGPRASFGRRLVAWIVDSLIVWVAIVILARLLGTTGNVLGLALGLAYYTYFEGGATGQTLGKRALGIRVYDFRVGGPIGYGRGLLRYFGKILSAIPCFLGFFWMLWDREKQTWADKIATTVVVPVSAYPVD